VVKSERGYLTRQFTTRLMNYVDDVEFWFDTGRERESCAARPRAWPRDLASPQRIEAVRAASIPESDGVDRPGRSNGPRPG